MTREDEVLDWVINAIADDYEDFEQVFKLAKRWATEGGREAPSPTEIAVGLTALRFPNQSGERRCRLLKSTETCPTTST